MVIAIVLIGTVLFMGVLVGCLTWLLNSEEEPQVKTEEALSLPPAICESPAPDLEAVPEKVVLKEPLVLPQPPVSAPINMPMQAEESLENV